MKYFTTGLLFFFLINALAGQQTIQFKENTISPPASITDVQWIAGHWKGEAFGGLTEEVWTKPSAGSMMGSFKLSVDNKIAFYELCIIREVGNTILLQLKHFNHDLKGWEAKDETVDFRLVKIEGNKVFFEGFTFEKVSEEEMNIHVLIGQSDGSENEETFNYHADKLH